MLSSRLIGLSRSAAGTDPYWANVSSLLHLDGADTSTSFPDVTGLVWTPEGNAQISTAQSKFGGASAKFDGNADRLVSAANANLTFGTGDFTVEMFVRSTVGGGSTYFFSPAYVSGAWIALRYDLSGSLAVIGSGITTQLVSAPVAQWHHVALTRASNQLRLFLNGALVFGPISHTANLSGNTMYVGGTHASIASSISWFSGNLDEVRITKGVARYTAAFTPPTAPFSQ